MAVSSLLPRKAAGGKTAVQSLKARLKYDQREDKTRGGELVSSYMCSPETAAEEFETARLLYRQSTGRRQPREREVIAYRILQSFKPGEITPEEANKLGYELAMDFTKGQHQFVVATHADKSHVHNHIEFNSINLDCDGKFNNFKDSALALQRLNDRICKEHGCSVVMPEEKEQEGKKKRGRQSYPEKAAAERGRSFKERLRQTIDRLLPESRDFEDFLSKMSAEGYEIKHRGKSLEFRAPGQERFTRSWRLGEAYTLEALKERTAGRWPGKMGEKAGEKEKGSTKGKPGRQPETRKVNLLVDIQAKMQEGKSRGYERWAKVFNLKETAKTLMFLEENGVEDYDMLKARVEEAGKRFDALSQRMKQLEGRMAEVNQMKSHIINYAGTREVYQGYRKAKDKKAYREEHREEIAKHEAAKAAFDALGGKKIPKAAELSKEYGRLLSEKKECYEAFKAARKEMVEFGTALQNVDRILGAAKEQEKAASAGRKTGRGR